MKQSTIPNAGLGLLTYKNILNEKQIISHYTRWKVNKQAINEKYSDKIACYAICNGNKPDNHCIDANHTTNSMLRYVNDPGDPCLNNLKFRQRTSGWGHCVFSVIGKRIVFQIQRLLGRWW